MQVEIFAKNAPARDCSAAEPHCAATDVTPLRESQIMWTSTVSISAIWYPLWSVPWRGNPLAAEFAEAAVVMCIKFFEIVTAANKRQILARGHVWVCPRHKVRARSVLHQRGCPRLIQIPVA
jgi:hypothetical protein